MVSVVFGGFAGAILVAILTIAMQKEIERKRVFREITTQFGKDWSEMFQLMSRIKGITDTESAVAFIEDHESSLFYIAYRMEILALLIDRQEIDVKFSNHMGLIACAVDFWKIMVDLNSLLHPAKMGVNLDFFPHLRILATRYHT